MGRKCAPDGPIVAFVVSRPCPEHVVTLKLVESWLASTSWRLCDKWHDGQVWWVIGRAYFEGFFGGVRALAHAGRVSRCVSTTTK